LNTKLETLNRPMSWKFWSRRHLRSYRNTLGQPQFMTPAPHPVYIDTVCNYILQHAVRSSRESVEVTKRTGNSSSLGLKLTVVCLVVFCASRC